MKCIGEVERRLYKGIDTGERLARLRPHPPGHPVTLPDVATLGNTTINLRTLSPGEVAALGHPYHHHGHKPENPHLATNVPDQRIAGFPGPNAGAPRPR